jgi:hypothetical protein
MANGKIQMVCNFLIFQIVNHLPFDLCHLPFEMSLVLPPAKWPLTRRTSADKGAEVRHPLPKGEGCSSTL